MTIQWVLMTMICTSIVSFTKLFIPRTCYIIRKSCHSHPELEWEDKAYSFKNRICDLYKLLDSYLTVHGNIQQRFLSLWSLVSIGKGKTNVNYMILTEFVWQLCMTVGIKVFTGGGKSPTSFLIWKNLKHSD